MDTGQEIIKHLKLQQGHYMAMKLAVEEQAAFIQCSNIGALTSGTAEVRGLMRKIRDIEAQLRPLRQSWSTMGHDRSPTEKREIDVLIGSIRTQITEIQEIKDQNQSLLKRSMEKIRKEMGGLNTQSRAAKAYQRRPTERHARFIDRSN